MATVRPFHALRLFGEGLIAGACGVMQRVYDPVAHIRGGGAREGYHQQFVQGNAFPQ